MQRHLLFIYIHMIEIDTNIDSMKDGETMTSSDKGILKGDLIENLSQNQNKFDELCDKIQSSWSSFVWLMSDNLAEKENMINSLKNSDNKVSEINITKDWILLQNLIIDNLTPEVMYRLNKILVKNNYNEPAIFKDKTEADNYINMIVGSQLWVNIKKYVYQMRRKELLYALLLISSIIKDNPELEKEKRLILLKNYAWDEDIDIYSLFSALQRYFFNQANYDFLSNCKFVMFDTNEWNIAYQYLNDDHIWAATKDRIMVCSSHIKL